MNTAAFFAERPPRVIASTSLVNRRESSANAYIVTRKRLTPRLGYLLAKIRSFENLGHAAPAFIRPL